VINYFFELYKELNTSEKIQFWAIFVSALQFVIAFLGLAFIYFQTRSIAKEMRRASIRHIYDRWHNISEYEIRYPNLHRMLMDKETLVELDDKLNDDDMKTRALSLLIFDQFAMIYNLGEKKTWWDRLNKPALVILRPLKLYKWWNQKRDENRSLLDINREYIKNVMRNPITQKCWRDYRLGETWRGTRFYDDVEVIISNDLKYRNEMNSKNKQTKNDEQQLEESKEMQVKNKER
jgi:hypothetical protein